MSDTENSNRRETRFLGQRFANRGFSATVNQQSNNNSRLNDSRLGNFVIYAFFFVKYKFYYYLFFFFLKNRSHISNEDLTINHKYVLPDSSTQALRLQRETDFLRCI